MALFGFGSNSFSQLNYSTEEIFMTGHMVEIKGLREEIDPSRNKIKKIAVGQMHTLVLYEDNSLYGWGVNDDHALGPDVCENDLVRRIPFPYKIKSIEAGDSFSAILTNKGRVYVTGTFRCGEFSGYAAEIKHAKNFTEVAVLRSIIKISGKHNHLLCLDRKGAIWALGSNDSLQLGYLTSRRQIKETLFPHLTFIKPPSSQLPNAFTDIFTGGYHSFALTTNGVAYGWGGNYTGQIGNGKTENSLLLQKVEIPIEDGKVIKVAAGKNHTLFLTEKNILFACGYNSNGQCGFTPTPIISTPRKVCCDVIDISTGHQFSVILMKKNENIFPKLFSFGFNIEKAVSPSNDKVIFELTDVSNQLLDREILEFQCGGNYTIVNYK